MSIDLTRFHSTFFNESTDQLEVAEQCLLLLERNDSDLDHKEKINELFRAIHSIKGSSGTLGFDGIAKVSHEFESLLEKVRNGSKELDDDLTGLCYAALDLLSAMIVSERDGLAAVDSSRIDGVTRRLIESYQLTTASVATSKTVNAKSSALIAGSEMHADSEVPDSFLAESEKLQSFLIKFAPNADFCKSGNDPLLYLRELAGKGSTTVRIDTSRMIALDQLDSESAYLRWEVELKTSGTEAEIVELFDWVQDLCELSVEKLTLPVAFGDEGSILLEAVDSDADLYESNVDSIEKKSDTAKSERRKPTVHVRADRLDSLINQISEIAISHAMFKQSIKGFSEQTPNDGGLGRLDRQLRDLQDTVLSLRMLPVRVLFGRFERAVRDARSELGKEVVLDVHGADTELDKMLIEKLADPIMHLVKNALDHGVETNSERVASGKVARAKISLSARHEGGSVVVSVADDGRGIDPGKVRAKAIDLGFAKATDQLTDYQWLQFIYHAGFSTATQVNQWSGRGVGLDVVQVAITNLGGELSLDSTIGQGTRFSIRLPLTLAIIDALMIRCGHQVFAVAMNFVSECLARNSVEFADVTSDIRLPKVHGEFFHALDLRSYLKTRKSSDQPMILKDAPFYMIVQSGRNKILLGVDEILGQEQIVVRSLERNFLSPSYASGATILGDGTVALILEPNALIKVALHDEPIKETVYG
jgi:two-component system, chemotaxis family, sensor kinase CheA